MCLCQIQWSLASDPKVGREVCADDEIVYGVMNLASILRHSTPREEE